MNPIEKLIEDLKEDACELYYKNRTQKQQIKLTIDMIAEARKLKELLENELQALDNLD